MWDRYRMKQKNPIEVHGPALSTVQDGEAGWKVGPERSTKCGSLGKLVDTGAIIYPQQYQRPSSRLVTCRPVGCSTVPLNIPATWSIRNHSLDGTLILSNRFIRTPCQRHRSTARKTTNTKDSLATTGVASHVTRINHAWWPRSVERSFGKLAKTRFLISLSFPSLCLMAASLPYSSFFRVS